MDSDDIVKLSSEAIQKYNKQRKVVRKKKYTVPRGCECSGVDIVEISQALQIGNLENSGNEKWNAIYNNVVSRIKGSSVVKKTMRGVFGSSLYEGFVVDTPKVLVTPPGSNPQLPHADDHCTSCLFGIIHLQDDQEPTRVAKYEGVQKDYPTDITVICDLCGETEMLPDSDYRRGVHVTTEEWRCGRCSNREGSQPHELGKKMTEAFGELLDEAAPEMCDSYCGSRKANKGSGVICLPQLIHQGPGNTKEADKSRYVLFFTLRPQYQGLNPNNHHRRYNPELQIHAPRILYAKVEQVQQIYEQSGCGIGAYMPAFEMINTSLTNEVSKLREENANLKRKVAGNKEKVTVCSNTSRKRLRRRDGKLWKDTSYCRVCYRRPRPEGTTSVEWKGRCRKSMLGCVKCNEPVCSGCWSSYNHPKGKEMA